MVYQNKIGTWIRNTGLGAIISGFIGGIIAAWPSAGTYMPYVGTGQFVGQHGFLWWTFLEVFCGGIGTGMVLYGFSEIIQLLHNINQREKQRDEDRSRQRLA